ncbi:hypothetical protein B0H10DRAFT_1413843 [Mycena sp. CBHHK59/15]|nr:hypothetical protein B0H10DRAFT_1413843 [Mycena sp. CBHHK59/15]
MTLFDEVEAETLLTKAPAPVIPPPPPPFKLLGSDCEKISTVLKLLRDARLSPADLLVEVLTNDEYNHHSARFFGNSGAIMAKVLDAMVSDERGEQVFQEWVRPTAIDVACEAISSQMDGMVKALSTASSTTHSKIPARVEPE